MPSRRPAGRRILALVLLACAGQAAAGLPLRVDGAGLDADEARLAQALADDVGTRLPARWMQGLPADLSLSWRADLPASVHGRRSGRRLLLNRRLLDALVDDGAPAGSAWEAARAALVHELGHAYDRAQRNRLSADPRLRALAGWSAAPWSLRRGRNDFVDRSPDAYELSRPSEFVAVNLEYFLLDPEYGCRRPALYRYFADHFGDAPAAAACAPGQPFLLADEAGAAPLLTLDPARIYQVDYLLAEGNEAAMSRWGHSMLRLVICAPGRAPGPDCRLDLAHHRVISFRAFVGDVQISGWRGLTGSYPSRLFLLPLDQVIEEYTRVELRGLRSLPLRLSREEIAGLLERAAQVHWSYDGRYYFISNNCAVETARLLRDGVPRLAGAGLERITPIGLLERLRRIGVADDSVLEDREQARRLGFYFEPASARYGELFRIARARLPLEQDDVQAWFALAPERRARWLPAADLRASAALLVLENAALRRQQLRLRDELKHRYLGRQARDAEVADTLAALRQWLGDSGFLSRPAELAPAGYGLPQAAERERVAGQASARMAGLSARDAALRTRLEAWLPEAQRRALRGIEDNIETIGRRLRALQAEETAAPQ